LERALERPHLRSPAYTRHVRQPVACALIAVLAGIAGTAGAQSLAEAARREREKKKPAPAAASPAPAYTEEDLKARRAGSKGTVSELSATGPRAAAASPEPSPSPTAEPDRATLEREWRARFAEARARVAEEDALAYEDRIEVVFVAGIPVQQRVRVKVETAGLRAAKQALDDLETELRRSGGLPGWARE
jgi:hypothetical protein